MSNIRFAQYGTKHAHAAGKLRAIIDNPDVELAGVLEPDEERRRAMAAADGPYQDVNWFGSESEMLDDDSIVAVSSEGPTHHGLDQTERCVQAGKHVWYDKPAGDNWPQWQRTIALAEERGLTVQMGYMFRYHAGFQQIDEWVKSGFLGDIFALRTRIGTAMDENARREVSRHRGGVFYELGCHMLDQVVWLLDELDRFGPELAPVRQHRLAAAFRRTLILEIGFHDAPYADVAAGPGSGRPSS